MSSTYGIIALTFERYLAVVHPMWHKAKFTRKKAYLLMISAWLVGQVYYLFFAIITSGITEKGICTVYSHYTYVSGQHICTSFQVIILYLFPLFALAYFYVAMIQALRRTVPIGPQGVGVKTVPIGPQGVGLKTVPIGPQGVGVKNQEKKPEKEVVQAMKNADTVVHKNIAKEIQHKQRLTPLETGVNIEVPEKMSGDEKMFAEASCLDQPIGSSKVYVVHVEPVEIPNLKILDSHIECEQNVINVGEKIGVSPNSITPAQIIPPIMLNIEPKKTGNIELVKNIKNDAVEPKSIHAPKESASTARAKRNVIKTLALVGCGFIICWSGTEVSYYFNDVGVIQLDFSGAFYNFTNVMVFISCCINPVVYCIQYKQFQNGVKYVLSHNSVWVYLFGEWKIDQPSGTRNINGANIPSTIPTKPTHSESID